MPEKIRIPIQLLHVKVTTTCTASPESSATGCSTVNVGGLVTISTDPNYFCGERAANKQIAINSDATYTYHKLSIAAGGTNPFTGVTETNAVDILVKGW